MMAGLVYNDRVWDPLQQHHFRWREISSESERVDIYRPGASYCIRSLSVISGLVLAAQQCCYDDRRRLLTRGWAAGTPALVSPDASTHLSKVTERLPWIACKGDFSRYSNRLYNEEADFLIMQNDQGTTCSDRPTTGLTVQPILQTKSFNTKSYWRPTIN